VLRPLLYLGGVFFALEALPTVWRGVAQLNPLLYVVAAQQYAVLGRADVSAVAAVVVLTVLAVGLWLLAAGLVRARVRLCP
jgi:ABC-2 type transport system permease protein